MSRALKLSHDKVGGIDGFPLLKEVVSRSLKLSDGGVEDIDWTYWSSLEH